MFEPSTSFVRKENQLSRRNDSFSTVSSSLAAAEVMQQYSNLAQNYNKNEETKKFNEIPNNPTKVEFENSDGIHVGDVVYHIHHHSPQEDSDYNIKTSTNSSTTDEIKESNSAIKKILSRRAIWLVPVILSIVSIIIGVSVVVYYLWDNNQNNNETTTEFKNTEVTLTEDTTTSTERNMIIPKYFITRENWGAADSKSTNILKLKSPIKRIIISHTRGISCTNEVDCISTVRSIQIQDSSLDDIAYNFLIGGDERIYEGRGFEYQGQHTQNFEATEYNSIGICIAFIGNYASVTPNLGLINLLKDFISTFVELGAISDDHIIVLQDDLKYFEQKADAMNEVIKSLTNFRSLHRIYRREEWSALGRRYDPENFSRIIDWVLIGHTVTPVCNDLNTCKIRTRSIQSDALSRNPPLDDIMYNIVFGGDGFAFEGVGWDYLGTHAKGFNDKTIGVGVIGYFADVPPNDKILNAILQVFDDAMALGKLTDNYKIFGRSDFGGPGPGAAFMNIIKEWCRHGNRTTSC